MRGLLLAAAAGATLASVDVRAQDAAPTPAEERAAEVVNAPTGRADTAIAKDAISAVASSDASAVTLTVSSAERRLTPKGETFAAMTFTAPIDKDKGSGYLLTERGLPSDFSAEFSVTHVAVDFSGPPDEILTLKLKYERHCRDNLVAEDGHVLTPQERIDLAEKQCKSPENLWDLDEAQLALHLSPQEVADVIKYRSVANAKSIFIFNASGAIGYGEFEYLHPADFSKHKAHKVPLSFTASAGWHPLKGPFLVGAGYQYRLSYEAANKRTFCPAPSVTPPTECRNAVFDEPEKNIDHSLFALTRFRLPLGKDGTGLLGLKPMVEAKLTYDLHDKLWGAELPVYLFLDKDKELRGGVRLSWQETGGDPDKAPFHFGVFLVKSFDPFAL